MSDALVWECGPHTNAWGGHDARCRQVPADVCAFALHRGLYCMRPAGHEATDGRVPRHDSTPPGVGA